MTVTPELDALVRACFANPKANLPRLVLADYLDEQGENDRATILRIQCALAPPKKGEKPKIAKEMGKPLAQAVSRLKERIAPVAPLFVSSKFVRGFLAIPSFAFFHINQHEKSSLLKDLFAEGWVESVRVNEIHYGFGLAAFEFLKHAGSLEVVTDQIGPDALAAFAAECRPGLPGCRLHRLQLPPKSRRQFNALLGTSKARPTPVPVQHHLELTPNTADFLARSDTLVGVRELTLGGNPGDDGIRAIFAHSAMRGVQRLRVSRVQVPTAAWQQLWRVKNANLEEFAIWDAPFGDECVAGLCAGSFFPSSTLRLQYAGVTSKGIETLIKCRRLRSLTELSLTRSSVDAATVSRLIRAPTFANAAKLEVTNTDVLGPELLPAVFAAPHRPDFTVEVSRVRYNLVRPADGLPRLAIYSTPSGRETHQFPAGEPCPEPLRALAISGASQTAESLRQLGDWLPTQPVSELSFEPITLPAALLSEALGVIETARPEVLSLPSLGLGVVECKKLAASPALATVGRLVLNHNPIRRAGALALAASPHRANLKELHLLGCELSRTDEDRIRTAFDGVNVTT